MFPGSDKAQGFTCSEKKCGNLCCFGLMSHFKELLMKSVLENRSFESWKILEQLEKAGKTPGKCWKNWKVLENCSSSGIRTLITLSTAYATKNFQGWTSGSDVVSIGQMQVAVVRRRLDAVQRATGYSKLPERTSPLRM